MTAAEPFELALGLKAPWFIKDIKMEPPEKGSAKLELHIYIDFMPGSAFPCSGCKTESPVHDTRERVWRHLNFFQYRCYVHARVPRVKCGTHGVRTVDVPWGREGSGFTLLMEGVILSLIRHLPVRAVAKEIGEHDTRVWRVLNHYVEEAKQTIDFKDVEAIGVDEYSHKGHNYITVFMSHGTETHKKPRVLHVEEGKGNGTVTAFAEKFKALHGEKSKVTDVTSDMCHGYRNAMKQAFPSSLLTVDRFHVAKAIGDAVDMIRRRELRYCDKRKQPVLQNTRYCFLKNRENLSAEQAKKLDYLLKLDYLDTVIAYNYRLKFQSMYEDCKSYDEAVDVFEDITLEMATSGIKELAKLAKSLTRNAVEILNFFVSRKTNAILEGFNSQISLIKNKARGFKNMKNFINMIYFCLSDLSFPFVPVMA